MSTYMAFFDNEYDDYVITIVDQVFLTFCYGTYLQPIFRTDDIIIITTTTSSSKCNQD